MTPWVISGVLLYFWGRVGLLTGILLLAGVLVYYIDQLGLQFGISQLILLASSILALPLSFYLAGSYLDNFVADRFSLELPLGLVFLLIGSYLVIEQGLFLDQLEHSLKIVTQTGTINSFLLLLEIFSKALMTGTGLVIAILFVTLALSLPLAWLTKNSRLQFSWGFPGLNLVLVLFLISAGYQLILTRMLA